MHFLAKHRIVFLLSALLLSCSRNNTLSLEPHTFGQKAKHVVWLQIDGLDAEHLAMTKYEKDSAVEKSIFESMSCTAQMWSFNLFDIRPSSFSGFISQSFGNQNIKNNCEDIKKKPVWAYFQELGYVAGIYENSNSKNESYAGLFKNCSAQQESFEDVFLWNSSLNKNAQEYFHYQNNLNLEKPGLYYDKSCQQGPCVVSRNMNITQIWNQFVKTHSKTFFIIPFRDYKKKLESGDILGAKEILEEIEETLSFFVANANSKSVSVVVSSSQALGIEFADKGKGWSEYQKNGRNIIYRRSKLSSPAWAYGAGAENFCGQFNQSEMLKRFIWAPEKSFIDLVL